MPSPPSSPPWPSIFHPPSSSSTTASTTAQSSSSTFIPVSPHNLSPWIDDKSALIVDIRPHAPHSAARIPTSLGLSVPSTLLKRPNFPLERLAEMLSSQSARSRFLAWPKASRILVYDTDTNAIAESSNIMGLLRKFQNSGFSGQLAWLRGGYQAVWRERKDLIDSTPLTPEADMDDGDDHSSSTILRPKHLPAAAFSLCSTTAASPLNLHHRRLAGGARPSGVPDSTIPSTNVPTPAMPMAMAMSISLPLPPSVLTSSRQKSAFNPFFDAIRQNLELSHGITERIPLRLPARVRRRVHELPFSWLQRIARRAAPLTNGALEEHAAPGEGVPDISHDAKGRDALVEEGMEALALQFYRIELAEQRRLMGVMEYHSKESGRIIQSGEDCTQEDWFPFSIAAGVEKGIKNRYRHIWPFEHARVKLHATRASDDDYVNASYVQPLGTRKKYIATQGPLPATFVDFWTLCWEQNVHVVVMLTTETEGSVIKCNNYWTETSYGPLRLKLVSRTGGKCIHHPEAEHQRTEEAGFFTSEPPTLHNSRLHSCKCESSTTIKRTFELSNTQYPQAGIRKVVHLQYLEWPDMNVPDDPRGILGLIKSVEGAVQETGGRWGCLNEDEEHSNRRPSTSQSPRVKLQLDPRTGILSHLSGCDGPVLLHCSAGVGRTGGFIVVDAVLDAVKREMKKRIYEENLGRVRSDYREPSSSPTRYPADGNSSATESKDSGDIDMASSPPPSSPLADADETSTLPPPPQPIHSHDHKRKVLEREDTLRPVVERKIEGMDSVHPSFGVDGVSKQADSSNLESAPPQFESLRRGTGRGRESVDMTSRWLKSIQSGSVRNAPPPSQSSPSQPSSIPQIFQGSFGPTTFSSSEAASEHNAGASYPLPSTSASTSSGASIFEDSSFYSSDRPRMSSLNTSTSGADSPKEAFLTINSHSHPKFNLGSGVLGEIREGIEVPRHVVGDKDHRGTNQPHHPISKKLSLHPTSSDGGLVPSPLSRSSSWMEKLRQRAVSAPGPMPPTQQGDDAPAGVHQGLSQNTEERVLNAVTNIRGGEEQVFDESRPGRSEKGSIEELDKSLVPPLLYEATLPNTTNLDNTPFIPPSRTQQITLEKIAPPAAVIPPTKQEGKECSRNIPQLSFILPPNIKSRSLPIETPLDQYYTPFSTGPVTDMHCSPFGGGRFTSFDYKDPRPLHEDTTPIWLSSYEDPILEVVQDLREQRMSLCQSLRQYVFVHAAIIEGALMIVDEERQREKEKDVFSHKIPSPPATIKPAITTVQEAVVSPSNAGDKENVPLPVPTSPLSSIPPLSSPSTMTWPTPQVFMPHPPLSLNLPIGKRSASPTELIKEGKAGEMLLSKRPSIKRRPTNGSESDREGLVAPPLSPSMKTQFFSGEVHERMDSATF